MGKPHGNSRLAKIGRPVLRRKSKGGAPKGNRNAHKHGAFSAQSKAKRAEVRALLRRVRVRIGYIRAVSLAVRADLRRGSGASVPPATQK
jgi:hypothetical protein